MFWDSFYKECKKQGTSPSAVCAAIGLSNATPTGWKNGTQPKADVLIKISDFLGVSVDSLLGREPEQKESTMSSSHGAVTGYDEQENRLLAAFRRLSTIEKENIIGRAEAIAELNDDAQKKGVV